MPLERRTPLRAQPRAKGNRAERAVVDILRSHGWRHARRNLQSGGQGGGDIVEGPADVHVEIKHCERCRIWEWIRQATGECRPTDIPVVVLRDNRHPVWWAVAPKDEVDALHQLTGRSGLDGRSAYVVVRRQQTTKLWALIDRAVAEAPADWLASVEFSRDGSEWWSAVRFDVLLGWLWIRETAT